MIYFPLIQHGRIENVSNSSSLPRKRLYSIPSCQIATITGYIDQQTFLSYGKDPIENSSVALLFRG
jgi:hypothetical protein